MHKIVSIHDYGNRVASNCCSWCPTRSSRCFDGHGSSTGVSISTFIFVVRHRITRARVWGWGWRWKVEGDLVRGVASICINYAEMRKYEHEQKEILPSNIGRRKNYNSWVFQFLAGDDARSGVESDDAKVGCWHGFAYQQSHQVRAGYCRYFVVER